MAPRPPSLASVARHHATDSPILPSDHADVFDDEFAEDYADSVHSGTSRRRDPFQDPISAVRTSPSLDQTLPPSGNGEQPPPRLRNSMSKAPEDYLDISVEQAGSELRSEMPYTNSSTPTTQPFNIIPSTDSSAPAVWQSSSQPASAGPSRSYSRFPQVLSRSRPTSLATVSSMEAGSSSSSSQGPAHPYTLYPQTVSSEAEDGQINTIPVGFPGHNQRFERRRGPEGEEQDIVGPNGQVEQLPPYTRYADTFNAKTAAAGLLSSNQDLGRESRSEDPLMELQERNSDGESSVQQTTTPASAGAVATAPVTEAVVSEKTRLQTWKEKSKRKLCGFLPIWALLLGILVIIVIAIICGSVIGAFVSRRPMRTGPPPFSNDSP